MPSPRDVRAIARAMPQPPALVGASLGGIASLTAIAETEGEPLATALVLVDVAPRIEAAGRQPHRRLHDRKPRRVRVARRGRRRDRRVQPAPTPAEEPGRVEEEPPPARRRPVGVALGSALRQRQVRLTRRDPLQPRRRRPPRARGREARPSRRCSSAGG